MPYKIKYISQKNHRRTYVKGADGRVRVYGKAQAKRVFNILKANPKLKPTKVKVK